MCRCLLMRVLVCVIVCWSALVYVAVYFCVLACFTLREWQLLFDGVCGCSQVSLCVFECPCVLL